MTKAKFDKLGLVAAFAGLTCSGFAANPSAAEKPELIVGVVSDVHMRLEDPSFAYCEARFRKVLRYFDGRKADAVIGAGDWMEFGWWQWFHHVGEVWREEFPNGRRSDGQPIEQLFIFGDHEIENFWNPGITRKWPREYIAARDIPTYGRKRVWEETFREPWAPIRRRTVKGYDFVLAHFTMKETPEHWGQNIPGLADFFKTNSFSRTKPLFYVQHKPPKGTVISPSVSGRTDGSTAAILSQYPNAVAFCGHIHASATSERNLWQGAFTCVEVPSMQYVTTDAGHENSCYGSNNGWVPTDPPQQMRATRTDRDGGQFMMLVVYKDRLVIERWNAVSFEKIAADWVIPLPNRGEASFENRAKAAKPVAFAPKARVKAVRRIGPDRKNATNEQIVVSFPAARSDANHARGYDYRVTATLKKHYWSRTCCEKWVLSSGWHLPERQDTNDVVCVFSKAEVPAPFDSLTFTVTPYDAFGQAGAPLVSRSYRPEDIGLILAATIPMAETVDRGGVTFDFAAASARRFRMDVPDGENLVRGAKAGGAGFKASASLPGTNGGRYRVSCRYTMTQPPGCRNEAHGNGGLDPTFDGQKGKRINFLLAGESWIDFSDVVSVPAGVKELGLSLWVGSERTIVLKDFAVVPETEDPVVFNQSLYGNIDESFAVARGQLGLLMFTCRRTTAKPPDESNLSFRLTLPKGVEFVDSSEALADTVRRQPAAGGGEIVTFRKPKRAPMDVIARHWEDQRGVLLRGAADLPSAESVLGDGTIELFSGERRLGGMRVTFKSVPPIPIARKPRDYFNGLDYGHLTPTRFTSEKNAFAYFRSISDCGAGALIAEGAGRAENDRFHAAGFRYVLPRQGFIRNGYLFGPWPRCEVPADIRYVPERPMTEWNIVHYGVCPQAVYGEDPRVTGLIGGYLAKALAGADGMWANWEPYAYSGCFCEKCRRLFERERGLAADALKEGWPQAACKKYRRELDDFHSREHAKLVLTVDKWVRAVTGGARSLGFIPGIEWADIASDWRARNCARSYRPIDYAGRMEWISPWGPYGFMWWTDDPYHYLPSRPTAMFWGAADLRAQVDRDYPHPNRPKLMSYPNGTQGSWILQPEALGMQLDSCFFNRWESSMLYFFPEGADARHWRAFAEATDRAARYEDFVRGGSEVTADVAATPVSPFAPPVAYGTRYVPASANASLLLTRAFRCGGRRIAAVLNFWEKGEAYCRLSVKNLAAGRYRVVDETGLLYAPDAAHETWSREELAAGIVVTVGAMRTRVFEIVPEGEPVAPNRQMTSERLLKCLDARWPALKKAADEAVEWERKNPTPPRDYMPMV